MRLIASDCLTHQVLQGEFADSIYLIKSGRVMCVRRGSSDKFPLGEGAFFGESALNETLLDDERKRRADVIADGALVVVQLMGRDFNMLMGSSLATVAARNFNRKILAAVKIEGSFLGTMLSSADLDKLVDALIEESYADYENVVEEGDMGDTFYIIKQGTATVSTRQQGDSAILSTGDYFGEMALLRAGARATTVYANGPLKCLALNRITFTRLLGPLQARLNASDCI